MLSNKTNKEIKSSVFLKLVMIFSCSITVMISIIGTIVYFDERDALYKELTYNSKKLVQIVSDVSLDGMINEDYRLLSQMIKSIKSEEEQNIEHVIFISKNGSIIANSDEKDIGINIGKYAFGNDILNSNELILNEYRNNQNDMMNISAPIKFPTGEILGYVSIEYNLEYLYTKLNILIFKIVLAIIISILICFVLSRWVSKIITNPINELVKLNDFLASGDITQSINIITNDELGMLGKSYNTATEKLREIISSINYNTEKVNEFGRTFFISSSETSDISKQISLIVDDLAKGFQDQSFTINDILSIIMQLDDLIQEITQKSSYVNDASNNTVLVAKDGEKSVRETINKMNEIDKTFNELSIIIKGLGDKSTQIGQIVQLISSIAVQTNLLALNAAIEAASAGEHGKGFAVVAEEVRKLAAESATASKKISELINEVQESSKQAVDSMKTNYTKVSEGTDTINITSKVLTKIIEAAQHTAIMADEISRATINQSKSSKDVVNAMNSLVATSQQAASSTQEVSSAIEEQATSLENIALMSKDLDDIATNLDKKVKQFKIN